MYNGIRAAKVAYRLAASLPLLHLCRFLGQAVLLGIRGGFGEGFFFEWFDLGDRRCMVDS